LLPILTRGACGLFKQENGYESIPIASHEGKHYTCFLPVDETKIMKSIDPQNATNVIIESDRRIKPKERNELLEPLNDQCFYRVSIQLFIYASAHIMNYW
jgi:protein OS-9